MILPIIFYHHNHSIIIIYNHKLAIIIFNMEEKMNRKMKNDDKKELDF